MLADVVDVHQSARQPTKRDPRWGCGDRPGLGAELGYAALSARMRMAIARGRKSANSSQSRTAAIGSADHASDPREPAWHLIQASILLGSVIAAWLTGYLAPRRFALAATALILLVLAAKVFEQFPMPPSPSVLVEWMLAPCLGIVVGTMAARLTVARPRSI